MTNQTPPKNDFGKQYHLLKPSDFKTVYARKVWTGNREFAANLSENQFTYARLGLVVSKKVSKRAVDRNRIKRLIREWFRHNKTDLVGFDLIVTAKPGLAQKTNDEVNASLVDIWKKALRKSS